MPFDFPSHTTSSTPRAVQREEVVSLLAEGLGRPSAEELVRAAALTLRLAGLSWTLAEALDVLDRVADIPGRKGVAALFAKTRLILEHH